MPVAVFNRCMIDVISILLSLSKSARH